MLPREGGDGPGGIVILYLVPAGTEAGRQFPQRIDRLAVPRAAGAAGIDTQQIRRKPVLSGVINECAHAA